MTEAGSAAKMNIERPMTINDHAIVLFDGECAFCNFWVRQIIWHDPAGYFRFASLSSRLGQQMLRERGLPADIQSVVLVDADGQTYTESSAALRIAAHMPLPMRLIGWLAILPRPWRDSLYRFVAANRIAWFGRPAAVKSCPIPDRRWIGRVLED
jgi:predicted DCC family thiol-disulfide oxidoreductase YuxK